MRILHENSILNRNDVSPGWWMPPTVRRVLSVAAGLALGLGLLCVHARRPAAAVVAESSPPNAVKAASKPATKTTWHEIGLASWYGTEFQGKQTASGETFNMNELSCAHRSLPLGTWVKVTNMHNRKWVVLRVNDRGPVPETRIADLSSAAARMLGMHRRGITRVRLDVIDPHQAAEVAHLEKLRIARQMADATQNETGD